MNKQGRIRGKYILVIKNPSPNPPFFKIVPPGIWEKKEKYLPLESVQTRYYIRIFITLGGYIFLGQMVSVGNYRGVVSSRDKIFYVGPSTHTWGYGKFVNARYARFTNSNAKLRLRLCLHLDFLPSLPGKKPAIRPRAFIRHYINQYAGSSIFFNL